MQLRTVPVTSRAQLSAFIELPYRLHAANDRWVPPLRSQQRRALSRRTNPFLSEAEVQLLLVVDGSSRPLGRVSVHVDHAANELHGTRDGSFGFFECVDDQRVADALLAAAADWLRARGQRRALGPLSFTTNDECGLLVEGFERRPVIGTPWSPPYYQRLLEGAGLSKQTDLLMWSLSWQGRARVKEAIFKAAEVAESVHGLTLRQLDPRRLGSEIETFMAIYNASWSTNWGFTPLSQRQVRYAVKELKAVIDPEWVYFVESGSEPVAVGLALPDYNQVLAELNGRLLPFGWLRALKLRKSIDELRVVALGVLPEFQKHGAGALLYRRYWETAERSRIQGGQMGWVLEGNAQMNRAMQGMGGEIVSRYRIYGLQL